MLRMELRYSVDFKGSIVGGFCSTFHPAPSREGETMKPDLIQLNLALPNLTLPNLTFTLLRHIKLNLT